MEASALFTATIALSTLMYFAVEKTLRKRSPTGPRPPPQRAFVLSMGSVMVLIAFIGLSIHATGGQTWRNDSGPSQETVSAWERGRFQLVRRGCNLQRLDRPGHCHLERPFQVLVIGNSHEPDGYTAFHRIYGEDPQLNLISFGTLNRCDMEVTAAGPISEVDLRQCRERIALLNDPGFVSRLDAVVYSASRPFLAKRRESWRLLEHLQGMNPDIRLVVLGGYLNTVYPCPELAHRFGSYDHCREPAHLAYNPFGERPRAEVDTEALDYLYIDKAALLCPDGSLSSCATRVGDVPAFYDEHHLTFAFAQLLGERIAEHYGAQLYALGFPAPERTQGESIRPHR